MNTSDSFLDMYTEAFNKSLEVAAGRYPFSVAFWHGSGKLGREVLDGFLVSKDEDWVYKHMHAYGLVETWEFTPKPGGRVAYMVAYERNFAEAQAKGVMPLRIWFLHEGRKEGCVALKEFIESKKQEWDIRITVGGNQEDWYEFSPKVEKEEDEAAEYRAKMNEELVRTYKQDLMQSFQQDMKMTMGNTHFVWTIPPRNELERKTLKEFIEERKKWWNIEGMVDNPPQCTFRVSPK